MKVLSRILLTALVVTAAITSAAYCEDLETHFYCRPTNERVMEMFSAAYALQGAGQLEQAAQAYLQVLAADQEFCDAMDNLGQVYRHLGRYDEAISWFRRSLEIVPDGYAATLNLAGSYQDGGPADSALAAFQRLQRMFPEDPEGYYGIGCIYIQQSKFDSAFAALLVAESLYVVRQSPWVNDARFKLGHAALWLENCGNCIKYWEPLYERYRDDANINYYLGICCLKEFLKTPERARKYLLRAEELGAVIEPGIKRLAGMEVPADSL